MWGSKGVHHLWARPCLSCPACLVLLTWIVFVMGGRWPYSWCFLGCCISTHRIKIIFWYPSILNWPLYHFYCRHYPLTEGDTTVSVTKVVLLRMGQLAAFATGHGMKTSRKFFFVAEDHNDVKVLHVDDMFVKTVINYLSYNVHISL